MTTLLVRERDKSYHKAELFTYALRKITNKGAVGFLNKELARNLEDFDLLRCKGCGCYRYFLKVSPYVSDVKKYGEDMSKRKCPNCESPNMF